MSRLIDADALIEEIAKIPDLRTLSTKTIGEAIGRMPTIEPEQKTGKWKEHKDYPGLAYLCSKCGYFTTDRSYYCPNCGARMEAEG